MRKALYDYHVHSVCSADAFSTIEEYVRRGIELGMQEITFTEHLDLQPDDPGYGYFDYDTYRTTLEMARAVAGNRLRLGLGMEITYQREFAREIEEFLKGKRFDYVMGSVHVVGMQFIYDGSYFDGLDAAAAYQGYYEELLRAVRSGFFDTLGHFDLLKRYSMRKYGKVPWTHHRDIVDEILREAVSRGVGLEINSSGFRGEPREPYPGPDILKRYRELGGEIITVGSDSHEWTTLGDHIPEAIELAREAGFRAVTLYRERKPVFVDI